MMLTAINADDHPAEQETPTVGEPRRGGEEMGRPG